MKFKRKLKFVSLVVLSTVLTLSMGVYAMSNPLTTANAASMIAQAQTQGSRTTIEIDIPKLEHWGGIVLEESIKIHIDDIITYDLTFDGGGRLHPHFSLDLLRSVVFGVTELGAAIPNRLYYSHVFATVGQMPYTSFHLLLTSVGDGAVENIRGTITIERANDGECIPIVDEDLTFEIPHIAAGEVALIGRVSFGPDNPLTLIVSAEDISGHGFFVALNDSPDIQIGAGTTWQYLRGNRTVTSADEALNVHFRFTSDIERTYYLYIGIGLDSIAATGFGGGFTFGEGTRWARNGNIVNVIGRIYGGVAELVSDGVQTRPDRPTNPPISDNRAVEIARNYVGLSPEEPGGRINFTMSYEDGRWVWRFWLSGSNGGLFHIDVETGEVLLFDPDAPITFGDFDAIRIGE